MNNNSRQKMTKVSVEYVNPVGRNYFAPSIFVETTNENEALKQAKQQSGLSRFKEWRFTTQK